MAIKPTNKRVLVTLSAEAAAQLNVDAERAGTKSSRHGAHLIERGLLYDDLLQLQTELFETAQVLAHSATEFKGKPAAETAAPPVVDMARYDNALHILFELQKETLREIGRMKAELLMTEVERRSLITARALNRDQITEHDKAIHADVEGRVRSIMRAIKPKEDGK